jgi:hypothetical protein
MDRWKEEMEMASASKRAAALGKLQVNGSTTPAIYEVHASTQGVEPFRVDVFLSAARDWLLDCGFASEAILITAGGRRLRVSYKGELTTDDPTTVWLTAVEHNIAPPDLAARYPELAARQDKH